MSFVWFGKRSQWTTDEETTGRTYQADPLIPAGGFSLFRPRSFKGMKARRRPQTCPSR